MPSPSPRKTVTAQTATVKSPPHPPINQSVRADPGRDAVIFNAAAVERRVRRAVGRGEKPPLSKTASRCSRLGPGPAHTRAESGGGTLTAVHAALGLGGVVRFVLETVEDFKPLKCVTASRSRRFPSVRGRDHLGRFKGSGGNGAGSVYRPVKVISARGPSTSPGHLVGVGSVPK